jgi:hypothetical protein
MVEGIGRNRTWPFQGDTKGSPQEENPIMSPRALLVLLTTAGVLASVSADAANMSLNLSVRSPSVSNTNVYAGPPSGHGGYPTPKGPPPLPRSSANDPYDTSTNLNPGGGGDGIKPGNKPNLK